MRNRTSIVRIYHLLDLSSFLFFIQNTTLSTQLILAVCRTRVIYELFDGPCSPSSLCGSVVEHRSAVSDSLCYVFFFKFCRGISCFSFCLQVWLLEVNINPALHTNCQVLMDLLPGVVDETLSK